MSNLMDFIGGSGGIVIEGIAMSDIAKGDRVVVDTENKVYKTPIKPRLKVIYQGIATSTASANETVSMSPLGEKVITYSKYLDTQDTNVFGYARLRNLAYNAALLVNSQYSVNKIVIVDTVTGNPIFTRTLDSYVLGCTPINSGFAFIYINTSDDWVRGAYYDIPTNTFTTSATISDSGSGDSSDPVVLYTDSKILRAETSYNKYYYDVENNTLSTDDITGDYTYLHGNRYFNYDIDLDLDGKIYSENPQIDNISEVAINDVSAYVDSYTRTFRTTITGGNSAILISTRSSGTSPSVRLYASGLTYFYKTAKKKFSIFSNYV